MKDSNKPALWAGLVILLSGIFGFNALIIGMNYLFSIPIPSLEHMVITTYVVITAGIGIISFLYWTRNISLK